MADDTILSTDAINAAAQEAAKTKGTVLITGGTYGSGTINLSSGVTLFVASDAKIIGSKNVSKYTNGLLCIVSADNVTITGGGTISGEGEYFVGIPDTTDTSYTADDGIVLKNPGTTRGEMSNITVKNTDVMSVMNCFKIGTETYHDISDVTVKDWTSLIDGVTIENVNATGSEVCSIITGASNVTADTEATQWTFVKNVTIKDYTAIYRESTQNLGEHQHYAANG